jgi:hypothetical protein
MYSVLVSSFHLPHYGMEMGAHGSVVVKGIYYKPEGRGFDTWWGDFLNLPNPSGRNRLWGLLNL